MADKLTYKGGARVVGNSGTAKLVLPAGGGDFHRVPKWWGKKGTVTYVEAAIFKVALDNGTAVRLILPDVKAHMTVEIRHDGAGNFTFPNEGHLERAAVTATDSLAVLVEYQFAKISGGAVLKRSISPLPEAPAVAFGNAINKTGTAQVGQTLTFTAATFIEPRTVFIISAAKACPSTSSATTISGLLSLATNSSIGRMS